MPDKLTDKEIVKDFKEIVDFYRLKGGAKSFVALKNTLDLINRLQAENEEQEQAIINVLHQIKDVRQTAKAEA